MTPGELMRQSLGSAALFGLGVSLLLSGCGDTQDSAAAGSDAAQTAAGERVDPCTLLTAAEVEQVLGVATRAGSASGADDKYVALCSYAGSGADRYRMVTVGVSRQNGTVVFENAKRLDEEGIAVEPVSGMGEDAFWVGDLRTLYVLKGGTNLTIEGRMELDQAKALAAHAAERLP